MVAALYRRYRPESFAEMIGQSQVTDPLMTALRTGRIGHAYLFSGPRGCGKTTSARILARCLNCAQGPTDTPCGTCPSCVELGRDGGGSLDVVEIDAASHGGVEDARDLRERAVFAPARDRFKIFIIDEAHMVTSAGFNALLKIVEEPPPHVKFVFATTEPEKVIGTIRSRTHHYPFRLIAPGTLIDYVQSLCDAEGVQVEPGVLPLVVRAGGGSVRDTLSILDQLIAGSDGPFVTAERAAGLLGFTGGELLDEVVTAFGAHDAAAAFQATDRVVQTGQDPRRFVEDLLERLRDLIVVSATTLEGAAAVFRGVPQDQLTRMFEQAQRFASGELSRIADVTSETLDRMIGATAPRLQLELMIARALVALDEMRGQAGQQRAQAPAQPASAAAPAPAPAPAAAAAQAPTVPAAPAPAAPAAQMPAAPAVPPPGAPSPATPAVDPISALAAARNAVTQQPAQPAAPVPTASESTTPNAAQTAASVRDFLREDTAGTAQDAPTQAAPTQAAPAPAAPALAEPAPAEPVPAVPAPATPIATAPAQAAAPAPAATDATAQADDPAPAEVSAPAADPAPAEGAAPVANPAAVAQAPGQPHPNEGAAAFGRPISDILSAAQIASIGTEPVTAAPVAAQPAAPMAPAAGPQAPAPTAPAQTNAAQTNAAPVEQPASQAQAPASDAAAAVPGADEAYDESESLAGDFNDLLEVWPDLLEEILEQDRAAWNAVKVVQPLSLEDDLLAVGFASRADLETFKAAGAGPLREAILSAVGVSVKYQPRHVPQGQTPGASAPGQTREAADPAAEEPHRAGQSAPATQGQGQGENQGQDQGQGAQAPALAPNQASTPGTHPDAGNDDPLARAAARLSALGPAMAAPAWAELAPATQEPEPTPSVDVSESALDAAEVSAPDTAESSAIAETPAPAVAEASAPAAVGVPASGVAGAPASAEAEPAPAQEPEAPVSVPTVSVPTGTVSAVASPTPASPAAAPQTPANYIDDPYANDPYAGEPSSDDYDDPYISSAPAPAPTPVPAGTPAPAPAAASAPAAAQTPSGGPSVEPEMMQRAADPEHQRQQPNELSNQASEPTEQAEQAEPAAQETVQPAQKRAAAPSFTRYGEAVVRETLGARFVEELPLAHPRQQN